MASRTNRRVLLGGGLLCLAALPCADSSRLIAAEGQPQPTVAAVNYPIASAARLAGDGRQTRFILDLDRSVTFRAVTLADPYRVVVDVPQINFQLPAGTGGGRAGLVRAFRYGLVMPGGSRIVFDLTGAGEDRQVLCRRGRQRPAGPARARNGGGRIVPPSWRRSPLKAVPSCGRRSRRRHPPRLPPQVAPEAAQPKADSRPVVVIDPGHGGIDNGTQSSGESEKKPGAGLWPGAPGQAWRRPASTAW